MKTLLRIALAQFDFPVGTIHANAEKIIALAQQARDEHQADVILFPELAISGYPPEDLLNRPDFLSDFRSEEVRIGILGIKLHLMRWEGPW